MASPHTLLGTWYINRKMKITWEGTSQITPSSRPTKGLQWPPSFPYHLDNVTYASQSPQCSWWGLVLAETRPVQWVGGFAITVSSQGDMIPLFMHIVNAESLVWGEAWHTADHRVLTSTQCTEHCLRLCLVTKVATERFYTWTSGYKGSNRAVSYPDLWLQR